MPRLDDDHTGTRIKEQRKLARLTQRQLADRLPYSFSLLNQVECGAKPANLDFVAAVAKALRVDVTVLTGQPYVTELQQDRLAGLVRPIREALDLYDLGADDTLPEKPAAQLVASAEHLCAQVRATHLRNAARLLPATIADLTTAAWRTQSRELWQALASTYRTAHDVTVKLGYYDLSSVALDRMDWAAGRASDPCLSAIRQYMRALVYFREGEYTIGQRLVAVGHSIVGAAEQTREALAVTGQLHLGASVIGARADDRTAVDTHIAEAARCAEQTGDASEVHWLSFGPTNVALHRMSAEVEMRQYDEALSQARQITLPAALATSRRAHFLIDKARSEMETGRTEAAFGSIVEARHAAPEQTRYHPGARETIKGLVHISRRTPDSLGHMAAWIGL
ncbi:MULTISPECIES: helix-turn-helix domain-containing protein [Streptomyces]|uniref:XRE family transcriptional regulator n=3 Tax=Streptomyces TaxID=1883 RepID=A0A652KP89_9ACTN|nr:MULTISPECIES: helix-turn-helix transcriptional regulator [unclassified Streptomyces]WSS60561.1 helix-turn-helix domain-containing protein [Streptomyces sp. NBC_01177]WSS67608.1 helix-turn-helix domain-containing protein [Streptomyces sp. NBC_01175]WSS74599.1 helix-turn-helix domain-containing protein [Streptomyces sp. NBC_01174]MDX3326162.1 helix-turn-helix transcriptional regulator [Streptomyces sp. ME02-6979-3A]MDX3432428.1 helix-turn-helix transcriptional regulator [Streptomyces sp. ME01